MAFRHALFGGDSSVITCLDYRVPVEYTFYTICPSFFAPAILVWLLFCVCFGTGDCFVNCGLHFFNLSPQLVDNWFPRVADFLVVFSVKVSQTFLDFYGFFDYSFIIFYLRAHHYLTC